MEENLKNLDIDCTQINMDYLLDQVESSVIQLAYPNIPTPSVVWDKKQKDLFIESLFLGIPCPILFLGSSNGVDYPLNGFNQIKTIVDYTNDKIIPEYACYLNYLNNKRFSELDRPNLRSFKASRINLVYIKLNGISNEFLSSLLERIPIY